MSRTRGRATLRFTRRLGQSLAVLVVAFGIGCVETAQCDGTALCDEGQVCFDYVCRAICTTQEDCGSGECAACQQNDSEGQIDHCFGEEVLACLPLEDA